jgi:hypothetical protein
LQQHLPSRKLENPLVINCSEVILGNTQGYFRQYFDATDLFLDVVGRFAKSRKIFENQYYLNSLKLNLFVWV